MKLRFDEATERRLAKIGFNRCNAGQYTYCTDFAIFPKKKDEKDTYTFLVIQSYEENELIGKQISNIIDFYNQVNEIMKLGFIVIEEEGE